MINYTLKCAEGHSFDSWFASAKAFDALAAQGHVVCAVCGSEQVEKALMAPALSKSEARGTPEPQPKRALSEPRSQAEKALAALKAHVEKNHDYVGRDFVREARAIHDGEKPQRPIWGEARAEEARRLVEDGVQVAPLPFTPSRKSN
ncbi:MULTISPECIES: DUF1178 family protein [unclassified Roseivivax]|uniref:DUF1178 family protein n=1 Tax=Roseivivax sp. GX 12232 TaxID=2900547 RepID=UPI001E5A1632|nr:DUF1178 family protein [Roseivivax sp. GX 12232]MCE0503804.1 DUF1178 family protein [Roseivivax sp. GX 12232]